MSRRSCRTTSPIERSSFGMSPFDDITEPQTVTAALVMVETSVALDDAKLANFSSSSGLNDSRLLFIWRTHSI